MPAPWIGQACFPPASDPVLHQYGQHVGHSSNLPLLQAEAPDRIPSRSPPAFLYLAFTKRELHYMGESEPGVVKSGSYSIPDGRSPKALALEVTLTQSSGRSDAWASRRLPGRRAAPLFPGHFGTRLLNGCFYKLSVLFVVSLQQQPYYYLEVCIRTP